MLLLCFSTLFNLHSS
uniref:Uncharacterized protein n=1 Tax=Rhizophora mucronata TaxID=61149 RepID=A0A2P2JWS9_RHIMU